MDAIALKIPIHFLPWKAKAEIARLRSANIGVEALNGLLTCEQEAHAKTISELVDTQKELDEHREKLAAVSKFLIVTHGLSGLKVANGRVVDLLKRPEIKKPIPK